MKKYAFILLSLLASGVASAGTTVVLGSANQFSVKTTDCTLMNENAKIALSSNVSGVVSCNDTVVAIAACHTGGRTASREVEELDCTTDPNTSAQTCVSFNPKKYKTSSGAAVAAASTGAPSVISDYPGTTCDAAGNTASTVATKLAP